MAPDDQFCFLMTQIHQNMSAECSQTSFTVTCWVQLEKYAKYSHFLVFVAIFSSKTVTCRAHNGPKWSTLLFNASNTSEHVRWMVPNKCYSHMLCQTREMCQIPPFLAIFSSKTVTFRAAQWPKMIRFAISRLRCIGTCSLNVLEQVLQSYVAYNSRNVRNTVTFGRLSYF